MKDKNNLTQGNAALVAKPKKKKKKVLIIVLVIIVAAVAVIGTAVKNMTKQVEAVGTQVEVEPVEKRDLSDTISIKGTIAGATSVNVTSKATSEITSINVQVGDVVKAGDELCTLDSSSIEEQVAELEKKMSNSSAVSSINSGTAQKTLDQARDDQQTQLADAQKVIDQAKDAYTGAQKEYDSGLSDFATLLAAKRAVEEAEDAYQKAVETTDRAIETAQTALDLDKYQDSDNTSQDTLSSLKKQLEDCKIAAPCGGVVTAVNMRVGDINTEKTTILTIEDTSALKVVASVQESDIMKVQEGMKASVTADATGDEKISGTVSRVVRVKSQAAATTDTQASSSSSTGYSVEITLDNSDLLVGMSAKAKSMIKENGKCLAVPYDLIQTDDKGKKFVMVAEAGADGSATAVKKNIEVGEEVDYYTEITGGDLKEGDKIIYDYTYSVTEGQTFTADQMYSAQDMNGTTDETGETGKAGNADAEVVE